MSVVNIEWNDFFANSRAIYDLHCCGEPETTFVIDLIPESELCRFPKENRVVAPVGNDLLAKYMKIYFSVEKYGESNYIEAKQRNCGKITLTFKAERCSAVCAALKNARFRVPLGMAD